MTIEIKCIDRLRCLLRFQTGAAEPSLESFRYGSALMYAFELLEQRTTWSNSNASQTQAFVVHGPSVRNDASNAFTFKSL